MIVALVAWAVDCVHNFMFTHIQFIAPTSLLSFHSELRRAGGV